MMAIDTASKVHDSENQSGAVELEPLLNQDEADEEVDGRTGSPTERPRSERSHLFTNQATEIGCGQSNSVQGDAALPSQKQSSCKRLNHSTRTEETPKPFSSKCSLESS